MFFLKKKSQPQVAHPSTKRGEFAMLQPLTSSNTNRRNLIRTRPIQWQNGAKAYCLEANRARLRSRTDKLCCKICSKYCPYRRPFRSFLRMLQKRFCFLARPCSCLFEFHFRKIVDVLVSLRHSGSLGDQCDSIVFVGPIPVCSYYIMQQKLTGLTPEQHHK